MEFAEGTPKIFIVVRDCRGLFTAIRVSITTWQMELMMGEFDEGYKGWRSSSDYTPGSNAYNGARAREWWDDRARDQRARMYREENERFTKSLGKNGSNGSKTKKVEEPAEPFGSGNLLYWLTFLIAAVFLPVGAYLTLPEFLSDWIKLTAACFALLVVFVIIGGYREPLTKFFSYVERAIQISALLGVVGYVIFAFMK